MVKIMARFMAKFEVGIWEDSSKGPVRFWGLDITQSKFSMFLSQVTYVQALQAIEVEART